MKLCVTDEHGHPIAFYDDSIHKDIPSEAFEISDKDWRECVSNDGCRRFVDGDLVECVRPSVPVPSMIEQVEARLDRDPMLSALFSVMDVSPSAVADRMEEDA